MHNREGLSIKRLFKACCDYDLWPLYILYVLIIVKFHELLAESVP